MDIFQIPDDYKPEHPLTDDQMNDITQYLQNHPLFMKNIPENIQQNAHLMALAAINQDQDPIEVAQKYNKQANQMLKENTNRFYHMKNAYTKYTNAIQLKCKSPQTNAKLHCNRASINLKLKNYGKVIEDCQECLKYDPQYTKAYFRQGKALLELDRFQQCIKFLKDRKQPQIKQLNDQAMKKYKNLINKNKQKIQIQNHQQEQIKQYCQKRGWKLLKKTVDLPENVHLKLIQNHLVIPLIIIYPEFKNFDLIASTLEQDTLATHLQQLLSAGLPWDYKKQYVLDNIKCYGEIGDYKLKNLPLHQTIHYIASHTLIRGGIQIQLLHKDNKFSQFYLKDYKIL